MAPLQTAKAGSGSRQTTTYPWCVAGAHTTSTAAGKHLVSGPCTAPYHTWPIDTWVHGGKTVTGFCQYWARNHQHQMRFCSLLDATVVPLPAGFSQAARRTCSRRCSCRSTSLVCIQNCVTVKQMRTNARTHSNLPLKRTLKKSESKFLVLRTVIQRTYSVNAQCL